MKQVLVLIAIDRDDRKSRRATEVKRKKKIPGFFIKRPHWPGRHGTDYVHKFKVTNDSNFDLFLSSPLTELSVLNMETVLIEEPSS